MTTEEEFYGGGGAGAPGAKFPTIGTTVGGIVVKSKITQQTDIKTGEKLFWEDGREKWQNEVIVLTDDRDSEITDDDGSRCIYVKGYMQPAVTEALEAVGCSKPEAGGELFVTYTGDRPSKTKGFNAAKLFEATYKAPTASASTSAASYGDEEPF